MRRFHSYGPIDNRYHYHTPRTNLVEQCFQQLMGVPDEGGHYFTIWAPRQRGKTWLMREMIRLIAERHGDQFAIVSFSVGKLRGMAFTEKDKTAFPTGLGDALEIALPEAPLVKRWKEFYQLFAKQGGLWSKPVILLIDEIDTLPPALLGLLVSQFRELYLERERNWLHGLALVGVRAVLGIDNRSGSPFNIQRSLYIPNLTADEVDFMFKWYERESGQGVEQGVIDRLFYETQGQPGLVGWLGELLTETYNKHNPTITMPDFDLTYALAINALPNNTILNIISKARQDPYKDLVLRLFQSEEKIPFRYDDPETNFLYLNGAVDIDIIDALEQNLKFASPFIQKRLFNYFAGQLFGQEGQLYPPFTDLSETITDNSLNITNVLKLHEAYIQRNKSWLYQNAPRRADLRIYEAVYHFNLYAYLQRLMLRYGGSIWPEFPTGNGKVDLLIRYANQTVALEVKSFVDDYEYKKGLTQAARYAHQLQLQTITLVLFVDAVDEASRQKYEASTIDPQTSVVVEPRFVVTG